MGFQIPQTAVVDVPPGAYDASIVACDLVRGQYGAQVRIKFVLVDTGEVMSLYTSDAFNPRSKLWAVVSGIFGRAPGPGQAFDSDWLIGRHCRVLVAPHTRRDGSQGVRIEAVLGAGQPVPAAPAVAVVAPPPVVVPAVPAGADLPF